MKKVIGAIGAAVGTVVKVDYNTSDLLREKFAMVIVSINLKEPLISKFTINGRL